MTPSLPRRPHRASTEAPLPAILLVVAALLMLAFLAGTVLLLVSGAIGLLLLADAAVRAVGRAARALSTRMRR